MMQSEKKEVMIAANKNNLRKGKIIHKKLAIPLGIIVQMTSTLFC